MSKPDPADYVSTDPAKRAAYFAYWCEIHALSAFRWCVAAWCAFTIAVVEAIALAWYCGGVS